MKTLLTSSISTSVGFPVKAGTLDFLQTASYEMMNLIAQAIVGREYDGNPVALYGCNNVGSGSSYDIQDGLIYYSGTLFRLTGSAFTLTGSNVAIITLSTGYVINPKADPVIFTDGVSRYVHQDNILNATQGLTGTGSFDYSTLKFAVQTKAATLSPTTNFSSSVLQYFRNRDGIIMLDGYIQCNTGAAIGTTVATLPAGYRPAYNTVFASSRANSGTLSTANPVVLRILSTGEIQIYASATLSNNDIIPLSGLQFRNYQ